MRYNLKLYARFYYVVVRVFAHSTSGVLSSAFEGFNRIKPKYTGIYSKHYASYLLGSPTCYENS